MSDNDNGVSTRWSGGEPSRPTNTYGTERDLPRNERPPWEPDRDYYRSFTRSMRTAPRRAYRRNGR